MPLASFFVLALVLSVHGSTYYVSPSGNDLTGNGSSTGAWKTINHSIGQLSAGDTLQLQAGAVFPESVYFGPGSGGTPESPIILSSPLTNRATILAPTNSTACYIYNTAGLRFENIVFSGCGMDIHTTDGFSAYVDDNRYCRLELINCEVMHFGGKGICLGSWNGPAVGFGDVLVESCLVYSNRNNGIETYGEYSSANTNVTVRNCRVFDNLGDPAISSSHSGSGIILGGVTHGLIERCIGYRNGERCTTTGGPVGIWTYGSADVIIQYCEAYDNRAANCDGGGFDIDGGCQNCTIQYCYSHDNDGAGYLICQYAGASAFTDNIIRYCISENDGRKRGGGFHFWSSGSSGGIQNTKIYNNIVFNSRNQAVYFQNTDGQSGTRFCNNIFMTSNGMPLVVGGPSTSASLFQQNDYWTCGGTFDVAGHGSLEAWRSAMSQELTNGAASGLALDPRLTAPGNGGTLDQATNFSPLTAYMLCSNSPMTDTGLDMASWLGIPASSSDFYANATPIGPACDLGAHEIPDADGDSIPDSWEFSYFSSRTNVFKGGDWDNDEFDDLSEYVAGTVPTNDASLLEIETAQSGAAGTNLILCWPSVAGRFYSIENCGALGGEWNVAVSNIPARPSINTQELSIAGSDVQFFRAAVQRN